MALDESQLVGWVRGGGQGHCPNLHQGWRGCLTPAWCPCSCSVYGLGWGGGAGVWVGRGWMYTLIN